VRRKSILQWQKWGHSAGRQKSLSRYLRLELNKIFLLAVDCLSWVQSTNKYNAARTRVARWYNFKQKVPILVNFVGSCSKRCRYMLWPFGIFFSPFGKIYVIWYIFPVSVCCTEKNLATLARTDLLSAKIDDFLHFWSAKSVWKTNAFKHLCYFGWTN
jgi:hypothetical protein